MDLQKGLRKVVDQLAGSLQKLDARQYSHPCKNLSGHTVGQHVRHIIDMFQCLESGYLSGSVDYELRKRDPLIENDRMMAITILQEIAGQVGKENKPMSLVCYYDEQVFQSELVSTSYFRELAYNYEHSIHHMALIRVALLELGDIIVDESYGVAASTIKYRQQCAQ